MDITPEEKQEIMEVVKLLKDEKTAKELIKLRIKNLEADVDEVKYNYKTRLDKLSDKISGFYSKLSGTEMKFLNKIKELYGEIASVKITIADEIGTIYTTIKNETGKIYTKIESTLKEKLKTSNKLLMSVLISVLIAIIGIAIAIIRGAI